MQGHARYRAEGRPAVKDVGERAADDLKRFLRAVHRQRHILADVERANIIKAEDVIGMAVRKNNRIQAVETHAQRLLPKVWGRIDHHVLPVAGKQQGWPQSVVMRVVGSAHAAVAAERRNAHRRTGTENSHFDWFGRHGAIRLGKGRE